LTLSEPIFLPAEVKIRELMVQRQEVTNAADSPTTLRSNSLTTTGMRTTRL